MEGKSHGYGSLDEAPAIVMRFCAFRVRFLAQSARRSMRRLPQRRRSSEH